MEDMATPYVMQIFSPQHCHSIHKPDSKINILWIHLQTFLEIMYSWAFYTEDGRSRSLRNVRNYLLDYTASNAKRPVVLMCTIFIYNMRFIERRWTSCVASNSRMIGE
jgi:hypothetical protein